MNCVIIFYLLVTSLSNPAENLLCLENESRDNLKKKGNDNSNYKNDVLNKILDPTNRVQKNDIGDITGNCGSDINYIIGKITYNVTISGSGPMANYSEYESPFYINARYVRNIIIEEGITSIGQFAFSGCSSLVSITLPNSLISIDQNSFAYSDLLSINIPESVTFIGQGAFYYCEFLRSVIIEGNVSIIKQNAFYKCRSLSYFNYKGLKVPTTESYVFDNSDILRYVIVNYDYESIKFGIKNVKFLQPTDNRERTGTCGDNAIYSMNLQTNTLTISGSGKMKDYYKDDGQFTKFSDRVQFIKILDNISSIGKCSFYLFYNVESVSIEARITSIGNNAFEKCSKLQTINIPLTVTSIGSYAFSLCTSLTAVNVSSVTSISSYAFDQCTKLTSFDIPARIGFIPEGLFANCYSLTTVNIAGTIEYIPHSAFYYCQKLESINMPNSVKYIYESSFQYCSSLSSITFPDSLISIGSRAFLSCTKLEKLVFSKNIEMIGNDAFKYCTLITSIEIPMKTTLIRDYAFGGCKSLNHVSYKGFRDPTIAPNAFFNCSKLSSIEVQSYYEDDMMSGITVNKIASTENLEVTGKCGKNVNYKLSLKTCELTITGSGQMYNYSKSNISPFLTNRAFIKHVSIDETVSSIGSYCFTNCTSITSISLNDNINYIGTYAFYNCTSLLSITIPSKVNYIQKYSFTYCKKLASVIFDGNITNFDYSCYESCSSLSYIYYKGYIEPEFEYTSFNKDYNLMYIDVMGYYESDTFASISVRKISSEELIEVNGKCGEYLNYIINPILGTLKISGTGEMQTYTSSGDTSTPFKMNVKYATIDSGITSIGDYSFYQCKALLSIDIPNTVTIIGSCAFKECSSLISLVLPNVSIIKSFAFNFCSSLLSLLIENDIDELNNNCFGACSSLKSVTYLGTKTPYFNEPFYHYASGSGYCQSAITTYNYFPDTFCFVPITKRIIPTDSQEKSGQCGSDITYKFNFATNTLTITGSGDMPDFESNDSPFQEFKHLMKNVVIEGTITSIGRYAFKNITSIESVTIICDLSDIYYNAFYLCSNISYFFYMGTKVPSIGSNSLPSSSKLLAVNVMYNYKSDKFGSLPVNRNIPEDVQEINGNCGTDATFTYTFSSNTLIIKGSGSMKDYDSDNSPFQDFKCILEHVIIEDKITHIGNFAFYQCTLLTTIVIPTSVISIGNSAFKTCLSLESIDLSSITTFGTGIFYDCISLKSIEISSGIQEISNSLFCGCTSLTSIIIPNTIQTIWYCAFEKCSNLTTINIPKSVQNIESSAFRECISLSSIDLSTVTTIGDSAFYGCESLVSVDIKSLNDILCSTFEKCTSLTSLEIPNGVERIPESALKNCKSLESISLPKTIKFIDYDALYQCSKLSKVTIPESVTLIESGAFYRCSSLASIVIPNKVIEIGFGAFANCEKLASVTLSENIESIGDEAFQYCGLITSITISMKAAYIGNYAFGGCKSLNHVSYKGFRDPTIAPNAFFNCSKLSSIEVQSYYEDDMMSGITVNKIASTENLEVTGNCGENVNYKLSLKTCELTITGSGQMYNYSKSNVSPFLTNRAFIKHVSIDETVSSIGSYCFTNCTSITSISLNDNINYIGTYAFYNCTSLSSITIPSKVNYIQKYSFAYCRKLTSIIFQNDVTSIEYYGFAYCSALSYIFYKGTKMPTIHEYGFEDNKVEFVDVMDSYESDTFNSISVRKVTSTESMNVEGNCGDNMQYTINPVLGTMKIFGAGEMYDYNYETNNHFRMNVKSLTIESGVTSIGSYAFYQCKSLSSVDISNTVTKIGIYAFCECKILETIVLPNVSQVGDSAFYECRSLQTLTILNNTALSFNSFGKCRLLSLITYKGSKDISRPNAFEQCYKLKSIIAMHDYPGESLCEIPIIKRLIPTDLNGINGKIGSELTYTYTLSSNTLTIKGTGMMDDYSSDNSPVNNLKYITKSVIIEDNVISIGCFAFQDFVYLSSVTIPKSVILIGEFAFCNCKSLTSIDTSSILSFGVSAFQNCTSLPSFEISSKIDFIQDSLLEGCSSITSLNISNSIKFIGKNAFKDCMSISTINNLESVISIRDYAFYNCSSLKSINVPSVTYFGDYIFEECASLTSFDIPHGINEITNSMFRYCQSISSINIPNSITMIGHEAFSHCSSLESVIIDSNLSSIRSGVFVYCPSLSYFLYTGKTIEYLAYIFSDENPLTIVQVLNHYESNHFCGLPVNRTDGNDETNNGETEGKCNSNAPAGCNVCEVKNPSKCLSCNKSQFFEEAVDSDGKCKCMSQYKLNENGKCVPLTGKCDESAKNRGCSVCDFNNPNICIECDENRGFNKSPSSNNICECKNEGYQINDQGQCVQSSSGTTCDSDNQIYGCLKCSSNNNKMCTLCDESQNFKQNPNDKGICTCQLNYILTINGECLIQIKKDPVLSFTDYTSTEDIPNNCLTSPKENSITLDASSLINSENFNNNKLYKTEVDENVQEVTVKNSAENFQVKINDRQGGKLDVKVDPNVPIQLDTSNSNFPINLPSDSQSVSIVVNSAQSTLEVSSNDNNNDEVNIGNVSVSSQSFVLNPKSNVYVDYVNLFGESELSRTNNEIKDAMIAAKKVNLQQGSVSKISNIMISEELNLAPNSVVTINEGVDFSSADISIYKTDLQPIDYSYFKFTEEVKQAPKNIMIKEMGSNEFLNKNEDKIIIIHLSNNIFGEDMCKKWAENVNISYGYKGLCTTNDIFNDGHNSVYATIEDLNANSPTPKKNGLGKGAIGGIVIGCVVGVAVIVVLVIFFVKRSKNKMNSSTEDANNDGNDII